MVENHRLSIDVRWHGRGGFSYQESTKVTRVLAPTDEVLFKYLFYFFFSVGSKMPVNDLRAVTYPYPYPYPVPTPTRHALRILLV